ncbi:MAG: hypothetical protein U0136_11270 [Bdellovibrionota bacterium]
MKGARWSLTLGLLVYSLVVTALRASDALVSPAAARSERPGVNGPVQEAVRPASEPSSPGAQPMSSGSERSVTASAAPPASDSQPGCIAGVSPEVELDMRRQQVEIEIRHYRRVTPLSAGQEMKLREILMREYGPPEADLTPEALEALNAQYDREIEAVVGKKAMNDLLQLDNDEQTKATVQSAEAEASYISRALDLPESKFEQLVNALGAENRVIEEAVSYRAKRLRLSTEQESELRKLWADMSQHYERIEEFVASIGGEGVLDESYYTYASSDHTPDQERVQKLYVRSKMKGILSPEQYQQLLVLDDVRSSDPVP